MEDQAAVQGVGVVFREVDLVEEEEEKGRNSGL